MHSAALVVEGYQRQGADFSMSNAITSFNSIYEAYLKCMKGKADNPTALKFHVNYASRCLSLCERLDDRTYEVGDYYPFEVYEPKHRLVQALNFEGKVVQHAFCDNALYDAICRRLITDNYAVQKGKGTHFGLDRFTEILRHYFFSRKARDEEARRKAGLGYRPIEEWDYAEGYVLKGDFSKFFYTLDHSFCQEKVEDVLTSITDDELRDCAMWLTKLFLDSTENPGIPIGNQSSQLIALLYLDWMDHWLKDDMGLEYGRYMDDFAVVHESKQFLKDLLAQIKERVEKIGLKLNPKTQIYPLKNGIDFLGFHLYLTNTGKVVKKVRAKSIDNTRRKLKKFRKLVDEGRMDIESVWQSYQSWLGHVSHGDSYHLRVKMDRCFYNLFPELKERKDNGSKTKPTSHRRKGEIPYVLRRTRTVACDREEPDRHAEQLNDAIHGQDSGVEVLRREGTPELGQQPPELRQQRLDGQQPPAVGEQLRFCW